MLPKVNIRKCFSLELIWYKMRMVIGLYMPKILRIIERATLLSHLPQAE